MVNAGSSWLLSLIRRLENMVSYARHKKRKHAAAVEYRFDGGITNSGTWFTNNIK